MIRVSTLVFVIPTIFLHFASAFLMAESFIPTSRAVGPPRKVVVGTCMSWLQGNLNERISIASRFMDEAAIKAGSNGSGRPLDLMILPETTIQSGREGSAKARAVPLSGEVIDKLGAKTREYHCYLLVPMFLAEPDGGVSNAAVLLNREGQEAGIYRKIHPAADADGVLEGGVRPGTIAPVFDCDFGKLGVQICWDMAYEDGWAELARKGAEIVALPSASPQTLRLAAYAQRFGYYVVSATPRNGIAIFNPIGMTVAQNTKPGVLVKEIDLAYAVLHYSGRLESGRLFTKTYAERAGFIYSNSEDTGVFWSNDPATPIGVMLQELKLREMRDEIKMSLEARRKALGK